MHNPERTGRFVVCSHCGQSNPTSYSLCHHCGGSLPESAAPPRGPLPLQVFWTVTHALTTWVEDLARWHRLGMQEYLLRQLHEERDSLIRDHGSGLYAENAEAPFQARARSAQLSIAIGQTEGACDELRNQCRPISVWVLAGLIVALFGSAYFCVGERPSTDPRAEPPRHTDLDPTRPFVRWRVLLPGVTHVQALAWIDDRLWIGGDAGVHLLNVSARTVEPVTVFPENLHARAFATTPDTVFVAGFSGIFALSRPALMSGSALAEPLMTTILGNGLLATPRDIWFGTLDDGVLRRTRHGAFERVSSARSPVVGMAAIDGAPVICYERGLSIRRPDGFVDLALSGLPPPPAVLTCVVDDGANLFVGSNRGIFRGLRLAPDRYQWTPINADGPQQISSLLRCGDQLVLGAADGLHLFTRGVFRTLAADTPITALAVADHRLFAGIPHGIDIYDFASEAPAVSAAATARAIPASTTQAMPDRRVDAGSAPGASMPEELRSSSITGLVVDNGNVWVGQSGHALWMWHGGRWRGPLALAQTATPSRVTALWPTPNTLFAECDGLGLIALAASSTSTVHSLAFADRVRSLAATTNNLVILDARSHIWRVAGPGSPEPLSMCQGMPTAVALVSSGDQIALITTRGIADLPERNATVLHPLPPTMSVATITTGVAGPGGVFHVGLEDGRIVDFDGRHYRVRGALDAAVSGICSDRGTLWGWTDRTVFRLHDQGFSPIVHVRTGQITGVAPISESGTVFVATTQGLMTEQLNP